MKRFAIAFFALALLGTAVPGFARSHKGKQKTPAPPAASAKQSVTQGSVTVEGDHINYKAIAGVMIIKNDKGKPYTSMSYFAYLKKGVKNATDRPITFFYNGGPGSSTVWLHMLAYGPKIAVVGNGTLTPPAPYKFVNNDYSLLDATDEVFIDAPGTGYGRVLGKDKGGVGKPKDVYGLEPDAKAFTRFITQYITNHSRWNSPKFLYGESYGTTRSAVLAGDLENRDVYLNGIILQSSILNFDISVDGPKGNPWVNIAYATGLPSYAATAWYHKKLPNQAGAAGTTNQAAESKQLLPFLKKVEHFAMNDYLLALDKGNLISAADKKQIAETMHQYTGLPVAYIMKDNLKVSGGQFAHELLGDSDDVTGRLDSRYSGPAMDPMSERAYYDPLDSAIDAPTVSLFNDYVRNTLDFGKGMVYRPEIYGSMHWSWKHHGRSGTPNVMNDLAQAMKMNPNLKVLLTGGYMDLGTPFYGAEYEMHQLPISEKLQKNISYKFFQSGHMVYVNPKAHKGLHDASAKFIEANSGKQQSSK
ncbi:MAG: S10 family peptidase [Gammaproteobacteria bacterium]